jgi:hypothetical protein
MTQLERDDVTIGSRHYPNVMIVDSGSSLIAGSVYPTDPPHQHDPADPQLGLDSIDVQLNAR